MKRVIVLVAFLLGSQAYAGEGLPVESEKAPAETSALYAGESMEREKLALIQHEINLLKAQVREAASYADTGARIRFRYDWLERDLDLMSRSIDDHLDAPRQPRAVPPLRGDYRQ